ncbi:MAG: hypothetical protein L0322_21180 [Chloroflexi bacterium]|nr:hypothetical protein [Chloroflexota bacterium]
MQTKEGIRFRIPSLGGDVGGRVLVVDNQVDLEITREFYQSLGESSAAFFSWVFVEGNALVQINGDLPEAQARKYEAVLQSVGG